MPATNQNLTVYAGNDVTINIPVLDDSGNKVDLSGATVRWWMGKSVTATGTSIFLEKISPATITIDIATDVDTAVIALHRADTKTIKPGTYYHECEVVDSSGNVTTVTTGQFILKPVLITDP
jgi:hypothetical protein